MVMNADGKQPLDIAAEERAVEYRSAGTDPISTVHDAKTSGFRRTSACRLRREAAYDILWQRKARQKEILHLIIPGPARAAGLMFSGYRHYLAMDC